MRSFSDEFRLHFSTPLKYLRIVGVSVFLCSGAVVLHAQEDIEQIRTRAEAGDASALNSLGNSYANGRGVAQSDAEALKYYRLAAESAHAPANFNLGMMYELGRGVETDMSTAFTFYLKAAQQGFPPAQFNVANMYSNGLGVARDDFEAVLWFKQAADNGVIEAQNNLGLAYEIGRGVSKDETQAQRWYRMAADQGYSRSAYNLALMLEEGRGSAVDEVAAASLYRAAAEAGFAPAQNNYGIMLAEGRGGLSADMVEAYVWFSLAVSNGINPLGRDMVMSQLTPEQLVVANARLAQIQGKATPQSQVPRPVAPEQSSGQNGAMLAKQNELAAENARLLRAHDDLRTQRDDLERKLQESHTISAQLTGEVRSLREAQRKAADEGELDARLQRVMETNRRLNREVRESTVQLGRLHRQLRMAERKSQSSSPTTVVAGANTGGATQGEVEDLRRQLTVARATNQKLITENAGLASEKLSTEALTLLRQEAAAGKQALADLQVATQRGAQLEQALATSTQAHEAALVATNDLQRQLDGLSSKDKEATNEATRLNESLYEAQAGLVAARRETEELRVQLQSTQGQVKVLKHRYASELENAERKVSEADVFASQLEESNQRLLAQVAELQSANKTVLAAKEDLERRLASVISSGGAASTEVVQLQDTLADTQARLVSARKEATNMSAQLQAAQVELSAREQRFEQDLAEAQRTATEADVFARQLEESNQKLLSQVTALQSSHETVLKEKEALEQRLATVVTGDDEASAELARLQATLADTQAQFKVASEEAINMSAQLQAARRELAAHEQRSEQDQSKAERIVAEADAFARDLEKVNQELVAQVKTLQASLKAQSDEHASGALEEQTRLGEMETMLRDVREESISLTNRVELLSSENERLERLSAQRENDMSALQGELALALRGKIESEGQLGSLQEELKLQKIRFAAELERSQGKFLEADAHVGALETSKQELTDRVATLQLALDAQANEDASKRDAADLLRETQTELRAAQLSSTNLSEKIQAMTGENSRLVQQLSSVKSELTSLQDELATAKAREVNLGVSHAEQARALQAEVEKSRTLQAELASVGSSTGEFEDQLRVAISERDTLKRERVDLIAAATQQSESLDVLQMKLDEATARLVAQQQREEQLEKSNLALEQDREAAQTSLQQLQGENQRLRDSAGGSILGGEERAKYIAEIDEAARVLAERETVVANLTSQVESLRKDLETSQKSAAAALAAQTKATQALPNAQAMLLEMQTLQTQVEQLEEQLAQDGANSAAAMASLASQLSLASETNKSLTAVNRSLLKAKSADVGSLQADIQELEERLAGVTAQNEKLSQEKEEQQLQVNDMFTKLSVAESRLADLQQGELAAQSAMASGETERATLSQQLSEANAIIEAQTKSVAELTGVNSELGEAKTALEAQLGRARAEAGQAQSELVQLRLQLDEQSSLARALSAQADERSVMSESLETQVASLTAQVATLQTAEARLTEMENLMEAQGDELATYQQKISEADTIIADQTQSVAELTGANAELEKEKLMLETQLGRIQVQASGSQGELAEVSEQLNEQIELVRVLSEKVDVESAQKLALQGQVDELSDTETLAARLQGELEQVQAELAVSKQAMQSQTTSTNELAEEKTLLVQQLEIANARLVSLQDENSRLAEADIARAEAEKQVAALGEASVQLSKTQRELTELRSEYASLNNTLRALERDRTARIATLQQDNAALASRLSQAQGTLDQIASAARLINPGAVSITPRSGTTTRTSRRASTTSSPPREHIVVEGDSLSRISLRYYGTSTRWQEIYEANREVLSTENVLRPGQRLKLP